MDAPLGLTTEKFSKKSGNMPTELSSLFLQQFLLFNSSCYLHAFGTLNSWEPFILTPCIAYLYLSLPKFYSFTSVNSTLATRQFLISLSSLGSMLSAEYSCKRLPL